jgi:hypothetical protein
MFRPKFGQLQALKIQNTLRKTFNGQGAITMTTRGLAVGSHKNKMEHTQQKTAAAGADWRSIKFTQTTVPNSPFTNTTVFLIQYRPTGCG